MDDVEQRAQRVLADVLQTRHSVGVSSNELREAAAALQAANLLADPDTARQRRLGEAVEKMPRWNRGHESNVSRDRGWKDCLDAIWREAGVERKQAPPIPTKRGRLG